MVKKCIYTLAKRYIYTKLAFDSLIKPSYFVIEFSIFSFLFLGKYIYIYIYLYFTSIWLVSTFAAFIPFVDCHYFFVIVFIAGAMISLVAGPAQGLGKLGLGLRPHQKKKNFLGKKAPLFIVKGPNFYKTIYTFSKGCTFFY